MKLRLLMPLSIVAMLSASCTNPHEQNDSNRDPPEARRTKPEAFSLLGVPLYARAAGPETAKLEADLQHAQAERERSPDDPRAIVWVGRRFAYLWRMRDAIDTFSEGIRLHPNYAPLYRHRGHRYISVCEFDKAIADLEKAAALIAGAPDEIEPDGMPNEKNIPLTTTAFNVWYHLGVAWYCKADFGRADDAFGRAEQFSRGHDDNLVATTHWRYMCLRRLGRADEAQAILTPIKLDMQIIENRAYHRLTLMYKGLLTPTELLDQKDQRGTDQATIGYGVGNWNVYSGDPRRAAALFRMVVSGTDWPAFGFIAAEAELKRTSQPP